MDRPARRLALLTLGSVALCAAVGGMVGCAKPLFSPDEYRSQYDRFDAARGEYAEQYTFDAYGRRRPNIQGRLSPRD